jgi:hypothetical protein
MKTHNARRVFPLLTWILKHWIIRTMDVGKHAWKRIKKSLCSRQRTWRSLVKRLHCPCVTSRAGGVVTLSLNSSPNIRLYWVKNESLLMWWWFSDKVVNDDHLILRCRVGFEVHSCTERQNISAFEPRRFIIVFNKAGREVITSSHETVYCMFFPSSCSCLFNSKFVLRNLFSDISKLILIQERRNL